MVIISPRLAVPLINKLADQGVAAWRADCNPGSKFYHDRGCPSRWKTRMLLGRDSRNNAAIACVHQDKQTDLGRQPSPEISHPHPSLSSPSPSNAVQLRGRALFIHPALERCGQRTDPLLQPKPQTLVPFVDLTLEHHPIHSLRIPFPVNSGHYFVVS